MAQIPWYEPPTIGYGTSPRYEIPVSGTCGATTQLTILSPVITIPFRITGIRVYFPDDAINNVRAYLLYANDTNQSTTNVPSGSNILARYSPTAYLIGHADVIPISCNILVETIYNVLKLHINNFNAYAVTLQAIFTIEGV